jgi:hypothetical protein
MLFIHIPPQFIKGAMDLLKADKATFESLMKQIKAQQPNASIRAFAESIVGKSELDVIYIGGIIDFLLFVGYQRYQSMEDPIGIADYVDVIIRSLKLAPSHSVSEGEIQRFKQLLIDFLRAKDAFGLSLRANLLQTQSERNFVRARIISDIRAVFDEEELNKPIGSVICHDLKIEFSEAGIKKEFFVGLDSSELDELGLAVARAKDKTEILIDILRKAEIPYIRADVEVLK